MERLGVFETDAIEEMTPELEIFDRLENVENADKAIARYRRHVDEGKTERDAVEQTVSFFNSFSDLEIKDQ